jgi:hypothetical protein
MRRTEIWQHFVKSSHLIPGDLIALYDFHEWRNALAVLSAAFPIEWNDITTVLREFRILRTDIGEFGEKGGGKSKVAIRMDRMFRACGWRPARPPTKLRYQGCPPSCCKSRSNRNTWRRLIRSAHRHPQCEADLSARPTAPQAD